MVTGTFRRRDHDVLTGGPDHRTGGEPAQPDLGSLQIREHPNGTRALGGDLTDHVVDGRVLRVRAVAEIQSRHIHSGVDEFGQCRRGTGGGS